MSHLTSNRLFRTASILAISAALAPVTAPMVASATSMIAGFTYQANQCIHTYGSAPTGEWFAVHSYTDTTTASGESGCVFDYEADAFVQWIAPANGTMSATICSSGDITPDWVLELREGCHGEYLVCAVNTSPEDLPELCYGGARIEHQVVEGRAYIIRVAGAYRTHGGDYGQSMLIEFEAAPGILGDLNFDGRVNGVDLGLLFANWTG